MKLKCIIVDDEQGARQILENYLGKLNYTELCGTFDNAVEAFHYLKQNKVDLLLLDINMPEVDGFGLLDMLAHKPVVIFTTAYSDHALKGFEYNAVDYLHKPIRFERFVVAMEKALKWASIQDDEPQIDTITIKADGAVIKLQVTDIYYIESLGNYIKVHTPRKIYIVHMTMNEMERLLPQKIFIRVHKSYIVNTTRIGSSTDEYVMINDTTIPIGKTYKKYFMNFTSGRG